MDANKKLTDYTAKELAQALIEEIAPIIQEHTSDTSCYDEHWKAGERRLQLLLCAANHLKR